MSSQSTLAQTRNEYLLFKKELITKMLYGVCIDCCELAGDVIYFYCLPSQEEHSLKVVKLANEQIAKYEAEVCNVRDFF